DVEEKIIPWLQIIISILISHADQVLRKTVFILCPGIAYPPVIITGSGVGDAEVQHSPVGMIENRRKYNPHIIHIHLPELGIAFSVVVCRINSGMPDS